MLENQATSKMLNVYVERAFVTVDWYARDGYGRVAVGATPG